MSHILTNPKVYNVTCTNAAQEYSQQLSSRVGHFMIQARQSADLWVAFASGASGTTYFTIPAGSAHYITARFQGQMTIYFQSPTAGTIAEILEWV